MCLYADMYFIAGAVMTKPLTKITTHHAFGGDAVREVRMFRIGEPVRYAQYDRSVSIDYVLPRKRNWGSIRAVPNNLVYYTIEAAGFTYDSRSDVPCDMDAFHASRERFQAQRRRYARD
jgi:hypothetical protein